MRTRIPIRESDSIIFLFVYDDLMKRENFEEILRGNGEILSIRPGFIKGKLYKAQTTLLSLHKLQNNVSVAYGMIYEIRKDEDTFRVLDGYMGSSQSREGHTTSFDLCVREDTRARPITITCMADFLKYKYTVGEYEKVFVYCCNEELPYVKYIKHSQRVSRINFNILFLRLI